jgi:hypothetical protein
MGTKTDDTEANTIARPLYLFFFITIVLIKEGRAKKRGMSREIWTSGNPMYVVYESMMFE